jgi:hypothetical protein
MSLHQDLEASWFSSQKILLVCSKCPIPTPELVHAKVSIHETFKFDRREDPSNLYAQISALMAV